MEKENKLKPISKAIYIIAKIWKILVIIEGAILILMMCIFPMIFKNINVDKENKTITLSDIVFTYDIEDNQFIITDEDNKTANIPINNEIREYFEERTMDDFLLYFELMFASYIILAAISYIIANSLEKLFKTIHKGKLFVKENIEISRKTAKYNLYYVIVGLILSAILSVIIDTNVSLYGEIDIIEILLLYAFTYVLDYGTKLQDKSKEEVYS